MEIEEIWSNGVVESHEHHTGTTNPHARQQCLCAHDRLNTHACVSRLASNPHASFLHSCGTPHCPSSIQVIESPTLRGRAARSTTRVCLHAVRAQKTCRSTIHTQQGLVYFPHDILMHKPPVANAISCSSLDSPSARDHYRPRTPG